MTSTPDDAKDKNAPLRAGEQPAVSGSPEAEDDTCTRTRSTAESSLRQSILTTMPEDHFDANGLEQPQDNRLRFSETEEMVETILRTADIFSSEHSSTFHFMSNDDKTDIAGVTSRSDDSPNSRYEIIERLGAGASGQVFAAFDNNLEREVAIKILDPKIAADRERHQQFIKESRLTGRLAHPNIVPVYDTDISDSGLLYFTMRRIVGDDLESLIDQAASTGRYPDVIASPRAQSEVIARVAEAASYAHNQDIIHQDIKPSNIILGPYGEVVLADWGTARRVVNGRCVGLRGTPAYMSPEQARREGADARSDIYCLGSSLFHLILRRLPVYSDNPTTFWERKRQGDIDEPSAAELATTSKPLLAIALRAMAPEPTHRYPDVAAMISDLRRFQDGLSIVAHEDSFGDVLRRFYRRNKLVTALLLTTLLGTLLAGGIVVRERARTYTRWHQVYHADFEKTMLSTVSDDWALTLYPTWLQSSERTATSAERERMLSITQGGLTVDGTFLSHGTQNLVYHTVVPGDMRVIWKSTPLSSATDLNCFIGARNRFDGYTFHIGGWENSRRAVLTKRDEVIDVVELPVPLTVGTSYSFMMSRNGAQIRLHMDGALLFDFHDPAPLLGRDTHFFGFDFAGNRTRISQVTIERRLSPELVPASTPADVIFAGGDYATAKDAYRLISEQFVDSDLAIWARYRQAVCTFRLGQNHEAIADLRSFLEQYPDHFIAQQAALILVEASITINDRPAAVRIFRQHICKPESGRAYRRWALRLLINDLARDIDTINTPVDEILATLEIIDDWEKTADLKIIIGGPKSMWLKRIIDNGYHQLVLERYPEEWQLCSTLLLDMGRYAEAQKRYGYIEQVRLNVLKAMRRYEDLVSILPPHESITIHHLLGHNDIYQQLNDWPHAQAQWHWMDGNIKAALEADPSFNIGNVQMGRVDDLIAAGHGTDSEIVEEARIHRDGAHALLSKESFHPRNRNKAALLAGYAELTAGKPDAATIALASYDDSTISPWRDHIIRLSAVLLRMWINDNPALLTETATAWSDDPRHRDTDCLRMVRYILGESDQRLWLQNEPFIDDAFLDAIRHDLAGEQQRALDAYRALSNRPSWPVQAALIKYRIAVLGP